MILKKKHGKTIVLAATVLSLAAIPAIVSYLTICNPVSLSRWNSHRTTPPFSGRAGHGSAVFRDKLWVIGGFDGRKPYNDIWSSPDGVQWSKHAVSPVFSPRAVHNTIPFKGRLWVIGGLTMDGNNNIIGLNDIWNSADGTRWTRVTEHAPFSPRGGHTCTVFNNRLWIIGGIEKSGDAWSSADGKLWTRATPDPPFGARAGHAAVVYRDRLWIIGGIYVDAGNNYISRKDVWSSADGRRWEKIHEEDESLSGGGYRATEFGGRIVLSGGFRQGDAVVASRDGTHWSNIDIVPDIGERIMHASEVFRNNLWIIGGHDGAGFKNGIFRLTPASFIRNKS